MTKCHETRGAAAVIALLAMLLLMALGLMLVLSTATETMIAAHFRSGQEAFYAADAGIQLVETELAASADWNGVLRGAQSSLFAVGSPFTPQTIPDGTSIDLAKATNLLNCGHTTACTLAEMDISSADRPWSLNNPRWNLYAYGPLSALSGTINSAMYVAVWVADDSSENDNDPTTDGATAVNPGSGVITIHAEAFGAGGTHKVLEATLARPADPSMSGNQMIAWREIR